MALTASNLFSESFTLIKSFLDTNISDPRHRFKKRWIHAGMPNITDKYFDGYPFMVVNVEVSEQNSAHSRTNSEKVFRIILSVYSDEATEVDLIADEIIEKFKDDTLTDNLDDFKGIRTSASPMSISVIGGKKIYIRDIGLLGFRRI